MLLLCFNLLGAIPCNSDSPTPAYAFLGITLKVASSALATQNFDILSHFYGTFGNPSCS